MPNSSPPAPPADPHDNPRADQDPAATDQGVSASGSGGDKSGLRPAYIGAGATILAAILAAIIAGIFALVQGGSGDHGSQSTTTSAPPGGLTTVVSEVWNRPVNGQRIIDVLGTAQNLAVDQAVLAFAGRNFNTLPFYSSLPARVSGDGTWKAEIQVPATLESLEFWGSVATVPSTYGACSAVCRSRFFAQERRRIAVDGPRSAYLTGVGRPVRGRPGK